MNPYADIPLTIRRIIYTLASAAWYLPQLFSTVILGGILFSTGKRTDKKKAFYHWYIYTLYRLDMKIIPGIRYRINNPHQELFKKGSILICNHQSFLDSVCMLILTPKILIVTNDHVWQNKFIHRILGFADFYPISRGLENSISFFREYIDKGYSIVIFPEGKRSQTCSILRFHRGAFYLAQQIGCDILPIFIHGVGHIMPNGCHWINKGAFFIEIGQRIAAGDTRYGDDYSLRTKNVRKYYQLHYQTLCRRIETAAYFNNCIVNLYGRVGVFSQRKVKRFLKQYADFSLWVDAPYPAETIIILNDEYGVIGLLFALVHPDKRIITTDNRNWLRTLMYSCTNLPKNVELAKGIIPDPVTLNPVQTFIFKPTSADLSNHGVLHPIPIA